MLVTINPPSLIRLLHPMWKRDSLTLITDRCKNSNKQIFWKADFEPCLIQCYPIHYHHSTCFPHCTTKNGCALAGEAELNLEPMQQFHSSGLNSTHSSYLVKMRLLFTFQTAHGFNSGMIASFKPSPAPFILQETAHCYYSVLRQGIESFLMTSWEHSVSNQTLN